MSATNTNDIFQYSTYTACAIDSSQGQLQAADLPSHGTDGIGKFDDGRLMLLNDKIAYAMQSQGATKEASPGATLSFAMVTFFQPSFRAKIPFITLEGLNELVSSPEFGPARSINTLLPFKITGVFESVDLDFNVQENVPGSVVGFIVPSWMKLISGPRIHAHFLDANELVGGKVMDFKMGDEATLSFAKCGEFRLGFPQGEAWENLKL